MPGDTTLEGQPFGTTGDIPEAIIASTEECDIVSVDSQTGDIRILADFNAYTGKASVFDSCSDQGLEYQPYTGTAEIAPGYIEDVEWAEPKYVLISWCCEPVGGRFEVLDVEDQDQPYRLSQDGFSPAIGNRGELLFSTRGFDLTSQFASLSTVPFEVRYHDTDPNYPSYGLAGDVSNYNLALEEGEEGSPNRHSFVDQTTWLEDNAIAAGIWTSRGESGWLPWVVVIDLASGLIASNARGLGWMLPAGDQTGNLVVAEQNCFVFYKSDCIGSPAKVVVVDSVTLDPIYEVEVDDTIADMDLVRGWLLVTLVDGRMGVLDLADGTFSVMANGIRNAVWKK